MGYEIYPLSKDRIKDFLYYFDNLAFSSNDEWKGCYCGFYHLINFYDEKISKRDKSIELIQQNKLHGYLAYLNGNVIGWCNTSDKESYPRLVEDKTLWDENEKNEKIKSIVCFSTTVSMRSKGVATQLLQKICSDAKTDTYDYVESYPNKNEDKNNFSRNYHGTVNMFEKCDFKLHKETNDYYVYRRNLK